LPARAIAPFVALQSPGFGFTNISFDVFKSRWKSPKKREVLIIWLLWEDHAYDSTRKRKDGASRIIVMDEVFMLFLEHRGG
jgi:hypothetical protein